MATRRSWRRPGPALVGIVLVLVATSCSGTSSTDGAAPGSTPASVTTPGARPPSDHVHGAAFNPADGRLYLASHEGLYRYDSGGPVRVGPEIDLMGFSLPAADHFYASGHPGAGVDLPDPVGLIESRDGGRTWTAVSRSGETDFHALAASSRGLVGFDGSAVLVSPDAVTWQVAATTPAPVHALAASPTGGSVLATSAEGLMGSTDGGASWNFVGDAPLLQAVAFAGETSAVGVAPDGTVHTSDDAGVTWTVRGTVGDVPQAVAARAVADGALDIVVVTASAVVVSRDGANFAPFRATST